MTAPLQLAASTRFPSVNARGVGAVATPTSSLNVHKFDTTGEQMASRPGRVKATDGGALLDRIRARVAFSPIGCWIWQPTKNSQGYGQLGIRANGKTVSKSVHRLIAAIAYGPIPAGLMALHTCDVRHCCNPAHLYLGTAKDNARDAKEPGRRVNLLALRNAAKTHCPQRHPYTAENTAIRKRGSRVCRTCVTVHSRRQSATRAAARRAA